MKTKTFAIIGAIILVGFFVIAVIIGVVATKPISTPETEVFVEAKDFNGCFQSGTQGEMKLSGVSNWGSIYVSSTEGTATTTVAFFSGEKYAMQTGEFLYIGTMKSNLRLVSINGEMTNEGYVGEICMEIVK